MESMAKGAISHKKWRTFTLFCEFTRAIMKWKVSDLQGGAWPCGFGRYHGTHPISFKAVFRPHSNLWWVKYSSTNHCNALWHLHYSIFSIISKIFTFLVSLPAVGKRVTGVEIQHIRLPGKPDSNVLCFPCSYCDLFFSDFLFGPTPTIFFDSLTLSHIQEKKNKSRWHLHTWYLSILIHDRIIEAWKSTPKSA